MDLKEALGKVIIELRTIRSLSQENLALDAEIDRTYLGEIERGQGNPSLEVLNRLAQSLDHTIGSLLLQVEQFSSGVTLRPSPQVNPTYFDRHVPLPSGLNHDQLLTALNRTLAILDQIALDPDSGDIQRNIYSGVVSNIVTKSIAESSSFVRNLETKHPDLYNPQLNEYDDDWGLELKASLKPNKGGESHNVGSGWFMVIIYKIIDQQTHIIQVEVAILEERDWKFIGRKEGSQRTPTASTIDSGTQKLRKGSVYLDPNHVQPIRSRSRNR